MRKFLPFLYKNRNSTLPVPPQISEDEISKKFQDYVETYNKSHPDTPIEIVGSRIKKGTIHLPRLSQSGMGGSSVGLTKGPAFCVLVSGPKHKHEKEQDRYLYFSPGSDLFVLTELSNTYFFIPESEFAQVFM